MPQTLTLIDMDDLRVILSEEIIKNEVWETEQAAEYLKTSAPTLLKEAKAGRVPGVQVGLKWKFSSIALYHYVSRHGDV